MVNQNLVDQYLENPERFGICNWFQDGQEILVEDLFSIPEGFCPWAWADLRPHIMTVMSGGELPFIKPRGTLIAGCTDWFRPVIFKLERAE
jgi:uncharacterized repeat protein (TIGR04076 family)